MTKLLLPPSAISSQHGEHSDQNARRFAEILHAYDPRMSLEYIPEADQTGLFSPYRIVKVTPERGHEVIKYLSAEDMKRPQDVLTWIWEGDFAKHRPKDIINKIELRERAERMMKLKADEDAAQERQDRLAWGFQGGRDHKHRLQLGRGRYMNI